MKVSIKDITQENVKDIPAPCKTCLYWENPAFQSRELTLAEKAKNEVEKATWFLKTLKEFGNCGKLLYADGEAVGYAQYSAANRFPNSQEYGAKKLGKPEENVAFISCLYITDENYRGKGLGEELLDAVLSDLKKRGFKVVETFVRKGTANNPSGPIELYLKKGFHVEEEIDPDFALVRMSL